jgi:DNA repair exonuclease SbcCD ATPase subunit
MSEQNPHIIEINIIEENMKYLHDKIQNVEKERLMYMENKKKYEMDIAALDDELNTLEILLENDRRKYDVLLQLNDYQTNCSHIFVDDLIDITPDKSKIVRYCVDCYYTENQ